MPYAVSLQSVQDLPFHPPSTHAFIVIRRRRRNTLFLPDNPPVVSQANLYEDVRLEITQGHRLAETVPQALAAALGGLSIEPREHGNIIKRIVELWTSNSIMRRVPLLVNVDEDEGVRVRNAAAPRAVIERVGRLAAEEAVRGGWRRALRTNAAIRKLKGVALKEENSGDVCSVCLDGLGEVGSVVSGLPCSHIFHRRCIERWLLTSHFCPMCRYEIPTTAAA